MFVIACVGLAIFNIVQRQSKDVASRSDTTTSSDTTTKKSSSQKKAKKNLPDVKVSDWDLVLVNSTHATSLDETTIPIGTLSDGHEVDNRIIDSYNSLAAAAEQSGITLTVMSTYRSVAYQTQLYQQDINKYLASGLTQAEAETKTAEYMTKPGYSEHHTGLALDVIDESWYATGNGLVDGFGATDAGKWLAANAAAYGFIIRYPEGKESITNINYEPWHIRYVGIDSAQYMVKHNLVLEEYIDLLEEAGKK